MAFASIIVIVIIISIISLLTVRVDAWLGPSERSEGGGVGLTSCHY